MTYHITHPTKLEGDTPAERLAWLLSHLAHYERREMEARRAERIAWLREFNPAALPLALRA